MMNAHKITAEFEKALCDYTGAPYAVAVDNCSNALFLALYYELHVRGCWPSDTKIAIPSNTYPAVPCEILHAGGKVEFWDNGETRKGEYRLIPTRVWDSALSFTNNMYKAGQVQCISFTGPFKHLKLGKGGAILTDDLNAYAWFKRARFSSRHECSYHEDDFDSWAPGLLPVAGWNFYMPIETAARGLHMMPQFYDKDGKPKSNPDLELPYPNLSKFKLWQ